MLPYRGSLPREILGSERFDALEPGYLEVLSPSCDDTKPGTLPILDNS